MIGCSPGPDLFIKRLSMLRLVDSDIVDHGSWIVMMPGFLRDAHSGRSCHGDESAVSSGEDRMRCLTPEKRWEACRAIWQKQQRETNASKTTMIY